MQEPRAPKPEAQEVSDMRDWFHRRLKETGVDFLNDTDAEFMKKLKPLGREVLQMGVTQRRHLRTALNTKETLLFPGQPFLPDKVRGRLQMFRTFVSNNIK